MCHSEESEQVSWIRELPTLLTPPNTVRLAVTPIYVFGCDPLSRWPGITREGSDSCNYPRRAHYSTLSRGGLMLALNRGGFSTRSESVTRKPPLSRFNGVL